MLIEISGFMDFMDFMDFPEPPPSTPRTPLKPYIFKKKKFFLRMKRPGRRIRGGFRKGYKVNKGYKPGNKFEQLVKNWLKIA